MGKIKTKIVKLFLLPLIAFSFWGSSVSVSNAESSLQLDTSTAPEGIPVFNTTQINKWGNNDELIENLTTESLIFKILEIIKYVLGGVFMIFLGLYVVNLIHATNKEEQITKFKDQMLWAFAGFVIIALAKPFSEALSVVGLGGGNESGLILTDNAKLLVSAKFVNFTYSNAAHLLQYLLGGVSLVAMGVSALRIISAVGDEESVKNARKSIVWAALGLVIAGATSMLVDNTDVIKVVNHEFNITEAKQITGNLTLTETDLKNPIYQQEVALALSRLQFRATLTAYVKYFQTFVGAGAVFMLFLAGFKMVSAGGNEEIASKQRKMIAWVFMGLGVILVSEAFVNIFLPMDSTTALVVFNKDEAIRSFSQEIGGFTNFVLTFSSALAILAIIVGALFITTAVANPEQAEKGKKVLLAAALGLVVTISAYALVNTVLSQNPNGNATTETSIDIQL